jgi:hypothetical protein
VQLDELNLLDEEEEKVMILKKVDEHYDNLDFFFGSVNQTAAESDKDFDVKLKKIGVYATIKIRG